MEMGEGGKDRAEMRSYLCCHTLFNLLLYLPHLGKISLAAMKAGRGAVCVVEREEEVVQVHQNSSDLEDKTD